jgi:hypothetical protein
VVRSSKERDKVAAGGERRVVVVVVERSKLFW